MAERTDALRRLAELAPEREKRKVNLYERDGSTLWEEAGKDNNYVLLGWRKVGGPFEVDA
jgi:hypothetical protein